MKNRKIYFFTPTFTPVGGVVKIFDYLTHAMDLGLQILVCFPKKYRWYQPLLKIPQLQAIHPNKNIPFIQPKDLNIQPEDLIFFSLSTDYKIIEKHLPNGFPSSQIIHIIQNVCHANPAFANGYALNLLAKPMSRIGYTKPIMEAIGPHLSQNSIIQYIPLGHNTDFFLKKRSNGFSKTIHVAYTTWKSKLGDTVANHFKTKHSPFKFKSIRKKASWKQLKSLYHWADVFLCTPSKEEGFYLPGLEAMASGNIVITPDAVGNREYCQFDSNCIYVELENPDSYIEKLETLATANSENTNTIRSKAYKTLSNHSLSNERIQFQGFLKNLETL